jgi:hypothetical protein
LVLENDEFLRGMVRTPAEVDGRSLSMARSMERDGGREYCAVPSDVMIMPGCRLRSSGEGRSSPNNGGIGPAVFGSGYTGEDADEGVLIDERSLIVLLRRMELLLLDRLLRSRYTRFRPSLPSVTMKPSDGARS